MVSYIKCTSTQKQVYAHTNREQDTYAPRIDTKHTSRLVKKTFDIDGPHTLQSKCSCACRKYIHRTRCGNHSKALYRFRCLTLQRVGSTGGGGGGGLITSCRLRFLVVFSCLFILMMRTCKTLLMLRFATSRGTWKTLLMLHFAAFLELGTRS